MNRDAKYMRDEAAERGLVVTVETAEAARACVDRADLGDAHAAVLEMLGFAPYPAFERTDRHSRGRRVTRPAMW